MITSSNFIVTKHGQLLFEHLSNLSVWLKYLSNSKLIFVCFYLPKLSISNIKVKLFQPSCLKSPTVSSTVCGWSLVCWFVKFLWAFNPFYGSNSSYLFLSPWNLMFSRVLERQERHKMNYAVLCTIFVLVSYTMKKY